MLRNMINVAVATMVALLVGIAHLHHVGAQRAQRKRIRELEDLISWYVTADLP